MKLTERHEMIKILDDLSWEYRKTKVGEQLKAVMDYFKDCENQKPKKEELEEIESELNHLENAIENIRDIIQSGAK